MDTYIFHVGDLLEVAHVRYRVAGVIVYEDISMGNKWWEYQLLDEMTHSVKWLSIEPECDEYAIYTQERGGKAYTETELEKQGYHAVSVGSQRVVQYEGNMDVDVGEIADFWEYEDKSEETILAIERWEDGKEYSRGHYLTSDQIRRLEQNQGGANSFVVPNTQSNNGSGSGIGLGKVFKILAFAVVFIIILGRFRSNSKIQDYLDSSDQYDLKTAITSDGDEKEKAMVYQSLLSVDAVARDIIDALEGDVEAVQQNAEDGDNSIAILTDYEYCLIYESAKVDDVTLIQVSSRAYAYSSTENMYHARHSARRYYRRFYFSKGYTIDKSHYKKKRDMYQNYDDSVLPYSASDSYSTYASSVRQSSIARRRSSGGGSGFGK